MNSVIIFEVSSKEEEIKRILISKGYYNAWTTTNEFGQKTRTLLPSNAVWKPNTNVADALVEIQQIIQLLNSDPVNSLNPRIELKKCIVLPSAPWAGINSNIIE